MSLQRIKTAVWIIVALGIMLWSAKGCHAQPRPGVALSRPSPMITQRANAKCLLDWSATQTGVRELTGNNDGPVVEAYQRVTGNHKGEPWCGSYQAAGQQHCRLRFPVGAGAARNWTRADDPRTYYIRGVRGSLDSLRPGHQVTFYYSNLGRVGHVGRLVAEGRSVRRGRPARIWYTNEGNTGSGGGREGGGVHVLTRVPTDFFAASNWTYK